MHCQCYVICGTLLDGIYSLPIYLIGRQHCDVIGHHPFMILVARCSVLISVLCIVSLRSYLLPPTPSSGPASPSISEEGASEEEPVTDKGLTVEDGSEEIKKGINT